MNALPKFTGAGDLVAICYPTDLDADGLPSLEVRRNVVDGEQLAEASLRDQRETVADEALAGLGYRRVTRWSTDLPNPVATVEAL